MKNKVRQVVASGFQSEQLIIRHKRQPDQGMPQIEILGGKRPQDAFFGETCFYAGVLGYVNIVIKMQEIKFIDLPINGKRSHN